MKGYIVFWNVFSTRFTLLCLIKHEKGSNFIWDGIISIKGLKNRHDFFLGTYFC